MKPANKYPTAMHAPCQQLQRGVGTEAASSASSVVGSSLRKSDTLYPVSVSFPRAVRVTSPEKRNCIALRAWGLTPHVQLSVCRSSAVAAWLRGTAYSVRPGETRSPQSQ